MGLTKGRATYYKRIAVRQAFQDQRSPLSRRRGTGPAERRGYPEGRRAAQEKARPRRSAHQSKDNTLASASQPVAISDAPKRRHFIILSYLPSPLRCSISAICFLCSGCSSTITEILLSTFTPLCYPPPFLCAFFVSFFDDITTFSSRSRGSFGTAQSTISGKQRCEKKTSPSAKSRQERFSAHTHLRWNFSRAAPDCKLQLSFDRETSPKQTETCNQTGRTAKELSMHRIIKNHIAPLTLIALIAVGTQLLVSPCACFSSAFRWGIWRTMCILQVDRKWSQVEF